MVDYGFSKTLGEAHDKWGHDRMLCDVVREVRIFRPLILASTFTGNITDGHGQHQASGEANQEAFVQAGDPKVCPEQIAAGLRPWSPLKVYARVPFFGASSRGIFDYATNKWSPVRFYDYVTKQWTNSFPAPTLEIPEGTWDPILGESYVQMARTGWGLQKSQNGGGTLPLPGPSNVWVSPVMGRACPRRRMNLPSSMESTLRLPGIASLVHSGDTGFLVGSLREIQQDVNVALKI